MPALKGPLGLRLVMTQLPIDCPCDGLTIAVQRTQAALARIAVRWNEAVRTRVTNRAEAGSARDR